MKSQVRVCMALVAACLWAGAAGAQETVNQGAISGRVLDEQSAAVPGALVSARHTETNVTADATSDSEGFFRFPYLKIGAYELRVRLDGFKDNRRTLTLSAGSAFDIPVRLEVGGLDASVTVVAETPTLETARSQIVGTVPLAEVQSLPMNGRNFLDLALLIPGVSPTNTNSTQLFAETSAVPGQGISIASQRNLSNSFIVDGLSANDDAAGLSGIPFGVDAIEQFQVVTGGGQAELGRALGGYVNVVTRSGTNTLRGTVYDFFRDDPVQRQERADQHQAADGSAPVRRQSGRSAGAEPDVLFRQLRAATAGPDRDRHHPPGQRRRDQRQARADRLRRAPGRHRDLSQSRPQPQPARQSRPSIQRFGSPERPLRVLRRLVAQFARRRHDQRAIRLDRPGQRGSIDCGGQRLDHLAEHRQRNASPDFPRRPRSVFDRSGRAAGGHRRRRDLRHLLEQPDAAAEQPLPDRQQPLASCRGARAPGRR